MVRIDDIDHGVLHNRKPKAHHSYTGEHVLEFQGHGSPVLMQHVVAYFIAQGCTMAMPGEFTQRAYLSGRMDLLQAQAVADLIAANHLGAAKAAMRSLDGYGLSNHFGPGCRSHESANLH